MAECDEMEIIHLSQKGKTWDQRCEFYANNEDSFLDFRGELKYSQPAKKRRSPEEADVHSFEVSGER